jgi:hypothetical protein
MINTKTNRNIIILGKVGDRHTKLSFGGYPTNYTERPTNYTEKPTNYTEDPKNCVGIEALVGGKKCVKIYKDI